MWTAPEAGRDPAAFAAVSSGPWRRAATGRPRRGGTTSGTALRRAAIDAQVGAARTRGRSP